MQIKTCILFFLISCFACSKSAEVKSEEIKETKSVDLQIKTDPVLAFDKTKWMIKEGKDYPYRYEMLNDLLDRHALDSLNNDEVIDMIGPPDRSDKNYLFYMIAQKRLGSWPLHTKTLVIKLSEDGTKNAVMIHE